MAGELDPGRFPVIISPKAAKEIGKRLDAAADPRSYIKDVRGRVTAQDFLLSQIEAKGNEIRQIAGCYQAESYLFGASVGMDALTTEPTTQGFMVTRGDWSFRTDVLAWTADEDESVRISWFTVPFMKASPKLYNIVGWLHIDNSGMPNFRMGFVDVLLPAALHVDYDFIALLADSRTHQIGRSIPVLLSPRMCLNFAR